MKEYKNMIIYPGEKHNIGSGKFLPGSAAKGINSLANAISHTPKDLNLFKYRLFAVVCFKDDLNDTYFLSSPPLFGHWERKVFSVAEEIYYQAYYNNEDRLNVCSIDYEFKVTFCLIRVEDCEGDKDPLDTFYMSEEFFKLLSDFKVKYE